MELQGPRAEDFYIILTSGLLEQEVCELVADAFAARESHLPPILSSAKPAVFLLSRRQM